MEKDQHQGVTVLEEARRVLAETSQWKPPATSEIHKQRCECKGQEETKPAERDWSVTMERLSRADGKASGGPPEEGKPLFSKYRRKDHYKSDLLFTCTGDIPYECFAREKNMQAVHGCDKPQEIVKRERQALLLKCGESVCPRNETTGSQNCRSEKKPYYECPENEKSLSHGQVLSRNPSAHSGRKRHECSVCGKSFNYRAELARHQRIHTGERPFECSHCGKRFKQRVHLIGHQSVHTGEKPFQCPDCGKSFSQKNRLIKHQGIHFRH